MNRGSTLACAFAIVAALASMRPRFMNRGSTDSQGRKLVYDALQ